MERREGLRKRVKEVEMARGVEEGGPHPPREAVGRGTTMLTSASTVEEVHESEDGGVNSSSDAVSS